jgi:hypothetical protein
MEVEITDKTYNWMFVINSKNTLYEASLGRTSFAEPNKAEVSQIGVDGSLQTDDSGASLTEEKLAIKPTKTPSLQQLTFSNVKFLWDSSCAHPPIGFMKYSYLKNDKPVEGDIEAVKEQIVLQKDNKKIHTLKWSNICGAPTDPGEIPVSLENF